MSDEPIPVTPFLLRHFEEVFRREGLGDMSRQCAEDLMKMVEDEIDRRALYGNGPSR